MASAADRAAATAEDFVSLGERLRALSWTRAAVAAATIVLAAALSGGNWLGVGICAGVFAVMGLLDLRIHRRLRDDRRPSWRELVLPMLVEAVATMVAVYLTGGTSGAARYALILQAVANALLLSHRLAVRNAVWVSLLLFVSQEVQELGLVDAVDQLDGSRFSGSPELWGLLGALWGATFLTASASAVNERGLRRERLEQHIHASFGQAVEGAHDATETAAVLASHLLRTGNIAEVLVVSLRDRGHVLARAGGPDTTRGVVDYGAGTLIGRMVERRAPVHVRRLDPVADAALLALLGDDAEYFSAVPLIASDDVVGAIVVMFGANAIRGVHRRTIRSQQRLATHGALALANAWATETLDAQARTDGLTGVANRRVFDEQLAVELDRAARDRLPLSLILCDVDTFKVFNDTHGHQEGDAALVDVAAALGADRRPYDLVARYGGEEFVVILPRTDAQGARIVAERLRKAISECRERLPVTASLGVATVPDGVAAAADVLATADRCLYLAKENGRNRVEAAVTGAPDGTARVAGEGHAPTVEAR